LKQFLLYIFYFYVYSNIHVALAVSALYLIFTQTINWNYLLFIFIGTVVSYNFMRLISFKTNRFFYKKYIAKNKIATGILLISASILALISYLKFPLSLKVSLIPLMLLSFFYNLDYRFAPFSSLRNNGRLKILIVAFVWAMLTVVLPYLFWNTNTDLKDLLLKFWFIFLYVLMLTLSFDQRDILVDHLKQKTIPQSFSNKLHYFYILLFLLLSILNFYIFNGEIFYITEFILIVSVILCIFSNENRSFFYTSFWIEALPIFWWLLIYFI